MTPLDVAREQLRQLQDRRATAQRRYEKAVEREYIPEVREGERGRVLGYERGIEALEYVIRALEAT